MWLNLISIEVSDFKALTWSRLLKGIKMKFCPFGGGGGGGGARLVSRAPDSLESTSFS